MSYTLVYAPDAIADLHRLEPAVQEYVLDQVDWLADHPRSFSVSGADPRETSTPSSTAAARYCWCWLINSKVTRSQGCLGARRGSWTSGRAATAAVASMR